MTKYQCNVCGVIYDDEWDAIRCHPDINVIDDDALLKRDAVEHCVELSQSGPTVVEDTPSESVVRCPACGSTLWESYDEPGIVHCSICTRARVV